MNKRCKLAVFLAVLVLYSITGGYWRQEFGKGGSGVMAQAAASLNLPGTVTATRLNVRTKAGTDSSQLEIDKQKVSLNQGTKVKLLSQKRLKGQIWYYISFSYNNKTRKGYVLSDYVKLTLKTKAQGTVYSTGAVKIRKKADASSAYVKAGKTAVALSNKTALVISKEVTDAKNTKWFYVSFTYKKAEKKGYIQASAVTLKGTAYETGVTTSNLNVRTGAGTNFDRLTYQGKTVLLPKGAKVTLLSKKMVDGVVWYQAEFDFEGARLKGYLCGTYIRLDSASSSGSSSSGGSSGSGSDSNGSGGSSGGNSSGDGKGDNSSNGSSGGKDDDGKGDGSSGGSSDGKGDDGKTDSKNDDKNDNNSNSGDSGSKPMTSKEFEAYLDKQGFPESYKPALRTLHEKYPRWTFKAYQTGLDWDTAVKKESAVGLNLISKNKASGWQSYEAGAYNWTTDSFIPFDGTSWVTASKEAVAYYMDPRNFLTASAIFQFEALEYQAEYQKKSGVERCLANTPMEKTSFAYTSDSGKETSILYSEAFIEAAKVSGVSPYHLASRSKQEVVTGSATFSGSASGKMSGYENIFNFYNIGASNSAGGGAVEKGLKYASKTDSKYLLPWNNRYRAIVGGGIYIGTNYINRGQNTIYLQKFNVTGTSTYSHQYMANVEAANSEATKTYNAYSSMLDENIIFSIPVYKSMPSKPAPLPEAVKNPNNWLKLLNVAGYKLSPEFSVADGGTKDYEVTVKSDVEEIKLTGMTASSKAAAKLTVTQNGKTKTISDSPSGTIPLVQGSNVIKIIVTAENGEQNTYKVTVTKEK